TKGAQQYRLPFAPHFGVVLIARRVDEAGHEALERVRAQQQAKALTLAESEDDGGVSREQRGFDLEQLVAWIIVKDLFQRFGRVRAARKPRLLAHLRDLVPQHGN